MVRVAFVVVGLLTNGFVLAVYAMLWAILPERGGVAPLHRMLPLRPVLVVGTLATIALLVTAVAAAATGTGPGAFVIFARVADPAVRLRRQGAGGLGPPRPRPLPVPTTPFERHAQVRQQRAWPTSTPDAPRTGSPTSRRPTRPARTRPTAPRDAPAARPSAPTTRRRGLRTWLGILVALGVTWAALSFATASGEPVGTLAWPAATLVVLGLALLFSACSTPKVSGRPFLLLPVTVLVAVGTLVALVPGQLVSDARGAVGADATSAADVTHLPIGDHTVDLSGRGPAVAPCATNCRSATWSPRRAPRGQRRGHRLGRRRRRDHARRHRRRVQGRARVAAGDRPRRLPVLTIEAAVGAGEIEVRS